MKRRTFLQLSPAVLALPISLSLSACSGSKTASRPASSTAAPISSTADTDSITDDVDEMYSELGLTLEEAKASADKVFILRNGLFYSLSKPLFCRPFSRKDEKSYAVTYDEEAYQRTLSVDSPETNNATLFDGDQLVYVSSDSLPDSIQFAPLTSTGYTLPLVFHGNPKRGTFNNISTVTHTFSYYEPTYQAPESYMEHTLFESDDFLINGLTLAEYTAANSMITIDYDDSSSVDPEAIYIVDLTDYVTLKDNSFILQEKNDHNVVTISFYTGTDYHEITLEATCVFFTFDPSSAITCNIQKTKDGYAVIDTSSLSHFENYVVAYGPNCAPFSILTREN